MGKVTLMDCTLRDGGYVNKWNFGNQCIRNIINGLEESNLDIIELGFMRDLKYNKEDSLFPSTRHIDELISNRNGKTKYAAIVEMANYFPLEKLEPYHQGGLDIIRYSFWKRLIDDAFDYSKKIIDKGYKLSVQPTRVEQYSPSDFEEMIKRFGSLNPYAIYIVDTFGLLTKSQLYKYAEIADKYLGKGILLGYHAHNNMQQAFSNATSLLEMNLDHDVILDASIFGMGRGAGNLNLELIASYLNAENGANYNIPKIYELFDKNIKPIYNEYGWGYSIPYFIAASLECNPNYASYYINNTDLTNEEIYRVLSTVEGSDKYLYSNEKAENFMKEIIKKR